MTGRVSTRATRVDPFHAMAFGQRASELAAKGRSIIRLSLGEPDFGAPPAVLDAMREAMDGRPLPYTQALGKPKLRAAIANFYTDRHGVEVDPRRIIITAGASAALLLITAATVNPGDDVLMADPSYPCNRQLVESFGGRVVSVPTTVASRYQLDATTSAAAWTERCSAVMVATPANPTGASVPHTELAAICDLAQEQNAWRIIDEIYLNLADPAPDGTPPTTVLATDPDAIVINSFSKYFGMTGWRLGWAVLPEELVGPMERLAVNYFLCAAAPTQTAALACFTPESLAVCEQRRMELLTRREIVLTGLAHAGLDVPVKPDGAFYVYFDVSSTGMDAWTFCERALEDVGVALTPGRDFAQATADTHVRLSYAASQADLREGLARLTEFVGMIA